jgi:hypothetical protein
MTIARRCAAVLAAAAAVLAVPAATIPVTAQAEPAHVAIVVAGDGQACVSWHSGMTGADVLDTAYRVTWGQQPPYVGFVLQIDGRGTLRPDDEHYWSYWRNTDGHWTYSGRGATNTAVTPGSVEGWSYVDGQSAATAPPAATYGSICAGKDPSPTPTRHPSTTARHPRTSATHPRSSTPASSTAPTTHHTPPRTTAPSTRAAATPTPATASRTHPPRAARGTTPVTSAAALPPAATATSALAAATAPTRTPHAASDHAAALPSWTTALAVLVVLAIGATALVRIRGARR